MSPTFLEIAVVTLENNAAQKNFPCHAPPRYNFLPTVVSWEKFCNSISLETDPSESWRKIKNFRKPKGQRDYPTLRHDDKVAKTNADKAQLFAESVERHFSIESEHFDSYHLKEVSKFIEVNHRYFYPSEDPDDYRSNEPELVEDVDPQPLS